MLDGLYEVVVSSNSCLAGSKTEVDLDQNGAVTCNDNITFSSSIWILALPTQFTFKILLAFSSCFLSLSVLPVTIFAEIRETNITQRKSNHLK